MAEEKITEASVLALIEEQKITASRGAELLGMPLQDFLDMMHAHGLTLCDETPEEIGEDIKDLRKVVKKQVIDCHYHFCPTGRCEGRRFYSRSQTPS